MKKLFLLNLLCICSQAYSQDTINSVPQKSKLTRWSEDYNFFFPIDSLTHKITYSAVIFSNDSADKNELFKRAKTCFVNLYKNSQKVIQDEDKEAGTIIGKGATKVYVNSFGGPFDGGFVNYTVTIACKDGRYKYIITDFIHDGAGSQLPSGGNLEQTGTPKGWVSKYWEKVKQQVRDEIVPLVASIKREMNKPSPQNDKW